MQVLTLKVEKAHFAARTKGPENSKNEVLSDLTEIPPLSRDRRSNTPVALCFLWYVRLSLLHPQFFSVKMAHRTPKTDLTRGIAEKACLSSLSRYRGHRTK